MTCPARSVAAAVLCTAVLVSCRAEAPEDVRSDTVVPVAVEASTVGPITAVIHATGTVTPAPGAEFLVVAPEAARIVEIPKAEGDPVAAGDLLVRFEIPATAAEVARQRAEVGRAQAQLQNAQAAQLRARELFERGVAARKETEDADRDEAAAQASLAQAEAARGAAETTAERSTVRAPFAGVIAKRSRNPGESIEGPASGAVLRLIDPRRLEVTASIPLADVPRVVIGAAGRVISNGNQPPIPLKVMSLPAAVDETTASVPIRLMFSAPPARLAVGTPVQVAIDAERHTGAVLVPLTAIVREGGDTAVFVVAEKKAVRRPVQLGITDGERIEILSGVKVDEIVIVRVQAGLPDGAAVAIEAPPGP